MRDRSGPNAKAGRKTISPRLVTFLYLLTRDELTSGVVERLIRDTEKTDHPAFSSWHIEALAREWAVRLTTTHRIDIHDSNR